ncbi:MAG: alpha-D-ribose 1-methylphosphonate 5-triphosphate diphosphatase [Beijerinckiaceae bacterium]|nr:alpha-D-ribose 1-methylphosphonate 5-triphosphate diphosphatase [Beijerinckiaceae bacterium]MCZ8301658.1 alpha-D-ribose 1-methylphosphonate 5-triphosphate diphosphatase [Beijerinckiaceae bacterium]
MTILIQGGSALLENGFEPADVLASREGLSLEPRGLGARLRFDAAGLLVLPGMVDIHGDAFERQIMPRPGVGFPVSMALLDTDRQLVANGITTACHGVTCSWEPGLRGQENANALIEAVEQLRPDLMADTHIHLRHETFNLDGEAMLAGWIAGGRLKVLAFNDHMEGIVKTTTGKKSKLGRMVERSGLDEAAFVTLVDALWARRDEVAGSVRRIAGMARDAGLIMLSHDDRSPAERQAYRALGCAIAEFPMTGDTAEEAVRAGEATVFGAPNVVRGGSHTGCPAAAEMVAKGLATILASDYYYPAMAQAVWRLDREGTLPLAEGWALVSRNPARHLGFTDRGSLAEGLRADLVLAEPSARGLRIVATFAGGRLAFCTDAHRIRAN